MLTLTPISLDDLANSLGYRNKERFRDDYVKPLKDNKLIEYTLEKANDPNQKYHITRKGNLFLGGGEFDLKKQVLFMKQQFLPSTTNK